MNEEKIYVDNLSRLKYTEVKVAPELQRKSEGIFLQNISGLGEKFFVGFANLHRDFSEIPEKKVNEGWA